MGRNARRFTLDKAPDSSETYSTILHNDTLRPSCGGDPSFADAA
jgi:hypothetical protein